MNFSIFLEDWQNIFLFIFRTLWILLSFQIYGRVHTGEFTFYYFIYSILSENVDICSWVCNNRAYFDHPFHDIKLTIVWQTLTVFYGYKNHCNLETKANRAYVCTNFFYCFGALDSSLNSTCHGTLWMYIVFNIQLGILNAYWTTRRVLTAHCNSSSVGFEYIVINIE